MSVATRQYCKLVLTIPVLTLVEMAAAIWIPVLGILELLALLTGVAWVPVLYTRWGERVRGVVEEKRNIAIYLFEVLLWLIWYFVWLSLALYLAMPYRGIP